MSSRPVIESLSSSRICLSCQYRLAFYPVANNRKHRGVSERSIHNAGPGQRSGQVAALRREDDDGSYQHDRQQPAYGSSSGRDFSDVELPPRQSQHEPKRETQQKWMRHPPNPKWHQPRDGEGWTPRWIGEKKKKLRPVKSTLIPSSPDGTGNWQLSRPRTVMPSARATFMRPISEEGKDTTPSKLWNGLPRRIEAYDIAKEDPPPKTHSAADEAFEQFWAKKQGYVGFSDNKQDVSRGRDGETKLRSWASTTSKDGQSQRRETPSDSRHQSQAQDRNNSSYSGSRNGRTPERLSNPRNDRTRPNVRIQEFIPTSEPPSRSRHSDNIDNDEGGRRDNASKRRGKDAKSNRRAEKFATADDELAEFEEEQRIKAERDRRAQLKKEKKEAAKAAASKKMIELPQFISVGNLSTLLKVRAEDFGQKLLDFGFEEVNNEHVLNFENASLIAMEYGYEPMVDRSDTEDLKPSPPPEDMSLVPRRPPVVTIMGHVDHGKTTLLDYLRQSSVAASEHGGITQHIGAFSVPMASGQIITFLDTPGHAAFLSMRQRGANVTDMVILVVAADDSVKPQTIEAIKHARKANVPIIVAINKVDKDEADIEKVKQDLLVHEIEVEDYGGDIQAIPVSGKTGKGLDTLEEAIVTQAEILDMRAEKDGAVEGWVLEATTKRAGRVATVLVRRGTLRPGDIIVAGTTWARVRTLKNEAGIVVNEAGPGTPVEVDGWRDQPDAGDEVLEAPTEQKATSVVEYRDSKLEQTQAAKDMEAINENRKLETEKREQEKAARQAQIDIARQAGEKVKARGKSLTMSDVVASETEIKQLYFIIKADVSGSSEAIQGSLEALPLSNQPLSINILRTGVGPVSEFDIDHIRAVPQGEGFLVSFNQSIPPHISGEAEAAGVKIIDESIIYKVIDNVRALVESKLPPIISRRVTGEVELAQVFDINVSGRKFNKVAGCRVRNGSVTKGGKVSVYRGGISEGALVYEGTISSLKSQKKDVQEMRKGSECGLAFDNWEDFKAGDIVQCYETKSEPRRLT